MAVGCRENRNGHKLGAYNEPRTRVRGTSGRQRISVMKTFLHSSGGSLPRMLNNYWPLYGPDLAGANGRRFTACSSAVTVVQSGVQMAVED